MEEEVFTMHIINITLSVPEGADKHVDWDLYKEQSIWYDYLIWHGTTDTYEVTLAIPLMEKDEGGWYLASRIKKEASNKEICRQTMSTMMQTFHASPYAHVVKEGESLRTIYKQHMALFMSQPYAEQKLNDYNSQYIIEQGHSDFDSQFVTKQGYHDSDSQLVPKQEVESSSPYSFSYFIDLIILKIQT